MVIYPFTSQSRDDFVLAQSIGAVSAIFRESDGTLTGYNMDWGAAIYAVEEGLRERESEQAKQISFRFYLSVHLLISILKSQIWSMTVRVQLKDALSYLSVPEAQGEDLHTVPNFWVEDWW